MLAPRPRRGPPPKNVTAQPRRLDDWILANYELRPTGYRTRSHTSALVKARREIQDELRLRRADELRAKEQAGNTTALAREEGGRLVVGARRAEALTVKAPPSCSFGPRRCSPPVATEAPSRAAGYSDAPDTPVLDTLDDYTEPGESSDEAAAPSPPVPATGERPDKPPTSPAPKLRRRRPLSSPPSAPRATRRGFAAWTNGTRRVVRVAEDGAADVEYETGL